MFPVLIVNWSSIIHFSFFTFSMDNSKNSDGHNIPICREGRWLQVCQEKPSLFTSLFHGLKRKHSYFVSTFSEQLSHELKVNLTALHNEHNEKVPIHDNWHTVCSFAMKNVSNKIFYCLGWTSITVLIIKSSWLGSPGSYQQYVVCADMSAAWPMNGDNERENRGRAAHAVLR